MAPVWHPIDFDDMEGLEEKLKALNVHGLFPTFPQAKAFLEVYMTKQWGEKGNFEVIQVREVR